jgi:hypothetical protein
MSISVDTSAIDKAIRDALMCGTGVMKFNFTDGVILCDHVPITDFVQFSEELIWRSQHTIYEEKNA